MKQIAILFGLIILTVASSGKYNPNLDLLKSISKFADGEDLSSKFAKSSVSPFSESEYDDDEEELPKNKKTDDDDEGVDVMAQLKSYQQKLSTTKDVKQIAPQKKPSKEIEESESEYDYDEDDDDSGNMWSRGISKKLQKQESTVVMPIQVAKDQISNDYKQFTSLKMPELQQKPQLQMPEIAVQKVTISDESDKERSSDFESKKQAQLEKYNKRFHIDEPKETKSIYEDDSLKQFMPKINFQPINIQEIPKPAPQESKKDVEVEEDEEEEPVTQKSKTQTQKQSTQTLSLDAFDLFKESKVKPQQQTKKIVEESDSESEDDEEEEEVIIKPTKKNKSKKIQQDEDEENEKKIERERERQRQEQEENENQRKIEEKEKQLEEQRQEQLRQQQLLEQQEQEQKIQKKQKNKKKSLSLEDFQQSLEEPQQSKKSTSFAQKEQSKGKVILEEKTFSLVKEEKPIVQEQKVFKMQVIPKKQQQLIQESESEGSEEEEEDTQPIRIKCLESKNKFIQQICQLCSTNVAFQVNQQNWQQIDMNNGFRYLLKIEFRQSFQPLIEFTFKSIGEVGSYYLSFKDHTVCLSAENLSKTTNVDKVLKHFTGNQLTDYNSPIDIPVKSQPINFLLSAEYDSLLNGFSCRRFQIAIKTDLMYQISKKNAINVKQIVFYKNRLKLKYVGLIQLNGLTHQASFDQEEGGEMTNLVITSLSLPKEQGLIPNLVDKYVDGTLVADMLESSEQMTADLQIQTHHKNDEIGLTFNLRRRKGK